MCKQQTGSSKNGKNNYEKKNKNSLRVKSKKENYIKTVFLAWIMDTMNSQYIPSNLTIYRIKYLE